MKRLLVFTSLLVLTLELAAQDIKMTIVDGIQNQAVKHRMERGISQLLND